MLCFFYHIAFQTGKISMELAEKQKQVKELEDQLTVQRREMSSMSQQLNDLVSVDYQILKCLFLKLLAEC